MKHHDPQHSTSTCRSVAERGQRPPVWPIAAVLLLENSIPSIQVSHLINVRLKRVAPVVGAQLKAQACLVHEAAGEHVDALALAA